MKCQQGFVTSPDFTTQAFLSLRSTRLQILQHFFGSRSWDAWLSYPEKQMGNTSSMLTQYDIEDVQEHCGSLFSQREIVSLYERFCQLDRNGKGFISEDEFLSVPEFALNPLSQRMLTMLDGLNFKDFVALLSVFSAKASLGHKVEFIFKLYDADGDGKVTRDDILEVLHDLSGPFLSVEQRQKVVNRAFEDSGYSVSSPLTMEDFLKLWDKAGLTMEAEIPVD